MSLFAELKRRNVFRVGLAYVVATWLLLQVVDVLAPIFDLPDWAPKLIFLILTVGFIPVIIFSWAFEMTPEGIKRESQINRAESITHHTAKKLDMITIGLLLAAIGVVVVDRFLPDDKAAVPQGSTQVAEATGTAQEVSQDAGPVEDSRGSPPPKSIAVLPFVNMSDDTSNEYFSDGISEEILNALAKVRELKVAGRTSSFAFKGQNQDLRLIGETLGVAHILEGSVRKAGNQVRITAQLVQVEDGFHLWSESYDRELDNVFAIQDEIAAAIFGQLKAHLVEDGPATATPVDMAAYELYLLARQRVYDRTAVSITMALDLLDQVVSIDRQYAPAWALKGVATILIAENNYGELNTQRAKSESLVLLETALELDPELPEALAGMGLWTSQFQRNHHKAIEYYRRALAINPSLTNAGLWYATSLAALGETRQSIEIGEQLFNRDPLNPTVRNNLAVDYANTGQPERALAMAEQLSPVTPGNLGLNKIIGEAHYAMGNLALAYEHLDKALKQETLHGPIRGSFTFVLMSLMEWDQVVDQGNDRLKTYGLSYLGRTEEALLLASRDAAENGPSVAFFQLLLENGRHDELIDYVESRWADLDSFEQENPEREGFGSNMMGFIAQSYGLQGNEVKFNDAMSRFGTALDAQLEAGNDNGYFSLSRAFHAMLSGDREAAIGHLDYAFTHGMTIDPRQRKIWPVFHPLEGDPAYEDVRSRMLEHLNAERIKLGLDRITV
jgi:TolB-like protein/Flp pilus assembly protein TadD